MVFSRKEAQYLLLAIVVLMVLGVGILKVPVYLALGLTLFLTVVYTWSRGEAAAAIGVALKKGVGRSWKVLIILVLISILIGLWKQNGTVATLIYYGFNYVRPDIFLVVVFILSSLVSMLLGTAIGTASTIGIVLMGLAESMGMPAEVVAGAVVSGAFVGDRSSPTSGPLHLMAAATDTRAAQLIPYLFTTMVPTYLFSSVFYYLTGLWVSRGALTAASISSYQELLAGHFPVEFFLLLPPLLLLVLAVLQVEIIPNLVFTVLGTLACSAAVGLTPWEMFLAAVNGYQPPAVIPFLSALSGGGVISFMPIFLVIATAMALSGLLEGTGVISQATAGVVGRVGSRFQLVLASVLFTILVAAVASTQTVSIVVSAAVFLPHYSRLGLDNLVLGRAIADSGVTVSGIIPWSIAALSPALVLGVSVTALAPYAVYCWLSPVVTLAFAVFDGGQKRDDQSLPVQV